MELYRKYRPTIFRDVHGQKEAVQVLNHMRKADQLPHVLLFSGPSGVGKTTLARIVAKKLSCKDADLVEQNAADYRGIDAVREIARRVQMAPMVSPCRVWILDEVHQITGDAADALLKVLEETPKHVYFLLCTTNPQKLSRTIMTRCTHLPLKPVGEQDLRTILSRILTAEDRELPVEVIDEIILNADHSPRAAVQLLGKVLSQSTTEDQLAVISSVQAEHDGYPLIQLLFKDFTWKEFARQIPDSVLEDIEGFRRAVLGYAARVLRNPKAGPRKWQLAVEVIDVFSEPWYQLGPPGLLAACFHFSNDASR